MNINLTLIGQMIAFAAFVLFCMKYVWPPILAAMAERAEKIADGLAAADRIVVAMVGTSSLKMVPAIAGYRDGAVVLLRAGHVVGKVICGHDVVELRRRVVLLGPCLAPIDRHIAATVNESRCS